MGRILQAIYTDSFLSSLLGFKGGTCSYLFYNLPRFSVDLDFDLLLANQETIDLISAKLKNLFKDFGQIKDKFVKQHTIFFLLSYGDTDHNIKIEISTRAPDDLRPSFRFQEYLGVSMLVGEPNYLFSTKLLALSDRKKFAIRDVFDVHHYLKNNWEIDEKIIQIRNGRSLREQLNECLSVVENIKDNELLAGIGELIDEKQKIWVKNNLKKETILLLKNYLASVS